MVVVGGGDGPVAVESTGSRVTGSRRRVVYI